MILLIDTSQPDKFTIALARGSGDLFFMWQTAGRRSQSENLLPEIEKIFKLKKVKPSQIRGIGVMRGPGSFTSLRIGIITANSLAYAWRLPIVGFRGKEAVEMRDLACRTAKLLGQKRAKRLVSPFYGREPNITQAKKA